MIARTSLLIVSLTLAGNVGGSAPARFIVAHHHTPDVRELLGSARGVAPSICLLAAAGVASTGRGGGGGWDAPAMSIGGEVRMRLREMMRARLSSDDQRALLDALGADDACVRHLAATIIGRSDNKAFVGPLATLTTTDSPAERQSAMIALGMLAPREAVPSLLRGLRDPSPDVRADAAWGLGRTGDKSSGGRVVSLLHDQYPDVRAAAAVALGRLEARDNIDELLRVLKDDSSPEVRRVAAWALGQLEARPAVGGLTAAMRSDRSAEVREMAAWALGEMNARDAIDGLTGALKNDESSDVRETAAWALGEMNARGTAAADALADALAHDDESQVRATAAWALGQVHTDRAPSALINALRDRDDDVRLKAAWALSQIADPAAIPAVTDALKQDQPQRVQEALVRALLQSGEHSEEALSNLLQSKDDKTREMAVRALSGRRGPWPWPWPWPRPRPMP
jgi:HEAT repeat protein